MPSTQRIRRPSVYPFPYPLTTARFRFPAYNPNRAFIGGCRFDAKNDYEGESTAKIFFTAKTAKSAKKF
jgi:hypothetical protein